MLPALLAALELWGVRDSRPLRQRIGDLRLFFLVLLLVGAAFLLVRTTVLGDLAGDKPPGWMSQVDTIHRWLTMLAMLPTIAGLLLWPAHLQAEYGPAEILPATSLGLEQFAGLLVLVSVVVLAVVCRRRQPVVTLGLALAALCISADQQCADSHRDHPLRANAPAPQRRDLPRPWRRVGPPAAAAAGQGGHCHPPAGGRRLERVAPAGLARQRDPLSPDDPRRPVQLSGPLGVRQHPLHDRRQAPGPDPSPDGRPALLLPTLRCSRMSVAAWPTPEGASTPSRSSERRWPWFRPPTTRGAFGPGSSSA